MIPRTACEGDQFFGGGNDDGPFGGGGYGGRGWNFDGFGEQNWDESSLWSSNDFAFDFVYVEFVNDVLRSLQTPPGVEDDCLDVCNGVWVECKRNLYGILPFFNAVFGAGGWFETLLNNHTNISPEWGDFLG
ncbi:hypothetical protein Patl1_25831 [Pistacia atlantica]|uniref:Uncharacterized protein n=1 Tax=Pistacia atlantica TaxID=434234 RepID=A0ACC1B3V2_9ROSI|nr:hypothetical protein Patl1_25831 [Pistacia atlantica]